MFEARLIQGEVLKRLVEAMKELIKAGNFNISEKGIRLQAMDQSHVSLVSLNLKSAGFKHFRADRQLCVGVNIESLTKILKCMESKDQLLLKIDDSGDAMELTFETKKKPRASSKKKKKRFEVDEDEEDDEKKDADLPTFKYSKFNMKLMELDAEELGIPEEEFPCSVSMPAQEFQHICSRLATLGDSLRIAATKESVEFAVVGDLGEGATTCNQSPPRRGKQRKERGEDDDPANRTRVKKEDDMDDEDDYSDDDEDDDEDHMGDVERARRKKERQEEEDERVDIVLKDNEPIAQAFAIRYLNMFAKATPLAKKVTLKMAPDCPLHVLYELGDDSKLGSLSYYLAPKIEDDDE